MLTFGGSYTNPLLPIKIKFGVLKQTYRLHLQAEFHLNVFIVLPSGGQKPQFWANVEFWGLLYRLPFTDKAQIWRPEADRRLHLCAKFHLKVFIVSASSGQKPQFWANFEF